LPEAIIEDALPRAPTVGSAAAVAIRAAARGLRMFHDAYLVYSKSRSGCFEVQNLRKLLRNDIV
jgi:hypothetical protein